MKYLRVSVFAANGATTVVTAETDLKEPIETVASEFRSRPYPGEADIEIFEYEGDLVSASMEGVRRAQSRIPEEEGHRATLRDWLAMCLYKMTPDGTLALKDAAPLDAKTMGKVFKQVAGYPQYKNQKIMGPSCDDKMVTYEAGRLSIKEL